MGLATLAVFSFLLAAIPLSTFFAVLHGWGDPLLAALSLSLTDTTRLVAAGVTGVVAVNLVLAAFVVAAWVEPAPPPPRAKDD